MLQRSSLPSTSTAELADTLQHSLAQHSLAQHVWEGNRRQVWQGLLPLPATWQQYLLACLALAVVLGGLLLHVLLAVQIADADFQLRQMRQEYARVERQNSELIYQIVQRSSLARMAQLAAEQGYVPATGRTYAVPGAADELLYNGAGATASSRQPAPAEPAAEPPTWVEGASQWWLDAQEATGAAAGQLWRDITGRVE